MNSVAEAAYLAGFLDGEGTIDSYRAGGVVGLRMKVTNTCLATLEDIQKIWGGKIYVANKNRSLVVKKVYVLRWSATKTLSILKGIQPYLKNKKKHCVVALQFQNTMHPERGDRLGLTEEDKNKRVIFQGQLKELNHRGFCNE